MKFLSTYKTQLAAVAITAILCIAIFAAYNSWVYEPEEVTKHAAEIKQLRNQLALSRYEKEELLKAYRDSMKALPSVAQLHTKDITAQTDIQSKYDAIQSQNQSMAVDSAVALARHRLRSEDPSARFDYSIMPN